MSGNGGGVQEMDSRSRMPGVIAGMEKTLERELNRAPSLVPDSAPEVKRSTFVTRPPLQTIADAIKKLVWDDNEKLAQMIGSHYQGEPNGTASMAAAIQRAADDLINEDNNNSRQ
jgi:hypothetical protein